LPIGNFYIKNLVIIGNKSDLDARKVSKDELKNISDLYGGIKYYEVSAKERINVDESFQECVTQVFEKNKKDKNQKCIIQ
jgi:GTPase SAR1 family protein